MHLASMNLTARAGTNTSGELPRTIFSNPIAASAENLTVLASNGESEHLGRVADEDDVALHIEQHIKPAVLAAGGTNTSPRASNRKPGSSQQ